MKNKPLFEKYNENMPVGFLLNRLSRKHMDSLQSRLENCGIQRTFGPILKELSICEGLTQVELACNMRITAPSMSVNLQKMENAGFLIKENDESDARQFRLYLTDKGRETAEKAEREIALANDRLENPLTKEERGEFKRLLVKMLENMSISKGANGI